MRRGFDRPLVSDEQYQACRHDGEECIGQVTAGLCDTHRTERAAFPHCDTRVLHAPGECQYCDSYPDWQKLRDMWGIAFTGHDPKEVRVTNTLIARELPCPADFNRPQGGPSDHRQWPGNVAR